MAFENFSGSAPPVFGSNLLFTSAIKSQPLLKKLHKSDPQWRSNVHQEKLRSDKRKQTLALTPYLILQCKFDSWFPSMKDRRPQH